MARILSVTKKSLVTWNNGFAISGCHAVYRSVCSASFQQRLRHLRVYKGYKGYKDGLQPESLADQV